MKFEINADNRALEIDIQPEKEKLLINYGGKKLEFEAVLVQPEMYSVLINNRSFVVGVCSRNSKRATVNGTPVSIELLDAVHLHLRELGWETESEEILGQVSTQIPGLITKVFYQIGDTVNEGDPLFLMEAMKMENEIKSPISGEVIKISVKEGQTVEKGTNIMEIG